MKNILQITAIVLILAGSLVSCGKNDSSTKTKGRVAGYIKCMDSENKNMVFGLYIITEKKDSLLAYNIPHETLNALLDVNIDDFQNGIYDYKKTLQIIFDYRKAKDDEIITGSRLDCPPITMFGIILFIPENFEQIIISNINKEDTK
jgi:hypothetical protein